jgi:hypothetical protein
LDVLAISHSVARIIPPVFHAPVLLICHSSDGVVHGLVHRHHFSPGSRREFDELWLGEVNLALSRKTPAELSPGTGRPSLAVSRQSMGRRGDQALGLSGGFLRSNPGEERECNPHKGSERKEIPARGPTARDLPYPAHVPPPALRVP